MHEKKTMIRVVKDKENPYLMVNKTSLHDCNLSAKAKGIHIYLLSLPDDWKIYIEELTNHFTDGRDSISSGIQELMHHRYVLRKRLHNEKGQFCGYEYLVFEVPQEVPQNQDIEPVSPVNGKSVNGYTVNGKSAATKYLSKQNNNRQKNNTHTAPQASVENTKELKPVCENAVSLEQLQKEIQAVIGETIVLERLAKLVHTSSEERIRSHLQHWHVHKKNQTRKGAGYFITVVENDIPPQEPEKKSYPTGKVTSQRDNFDQRKYSDEELEKFYANLT